MSQPDGYLNFDTEIDEQGFVEGIERLGTYGKRGLGILAGAVASVTAAMGAGVAAGLKYNATMEQYTTSFEVMTGSAEKAKQVMAELQKLGAETPFETETLAEVTQLLMNYGFTADEAIAKMKMLGDISQGNADKMTRIAMAYGQMSSAGKVSLEDVKQMIEAGFNPLQEISEATGESMGSLYDRISKGTLTVDELTASMKRATSEGGKYYQSMEKQAQTVEGMISTMKDNAMQLLGTVVQPISEAMVATLLPAAIEAIEGMQEAFEEDGVEGMVRAGSDCLAGFLTGAAEQLPSVVNTAFSIVVTLVESLIDNLPALLDAGLQMIMSLAMGIIDSIPMLIETVPRLINSFFDALWGFLPDLLLAGLKLIWELGKGIIKAIPTIIANADEIVKAIINVISAIKIFALGSKIMAGLGNGIKSMVGSVSEIAKGLAEKAKNAILNLQWVQLGKDIVSGIISGLKGMGSTLVSSAKNLGKSALDGIKSILKIKSPSQVFRDEVGKMMAAGVAVGFEDYPMDEELEKTINRSINVIDAQVQPRETAYGTRYYSYEFNGDDQDDKPKDYNLTVIVPLDGEVIAKGTFRYTDRELSTNTELEMRGVTT